MHFLLSKFTDSNHLRIAQQNKCFICKAVAGATKMTSLFAQSGSRVADLVLWVQALTESLPGSPAIGLAPLPGPPAPARTPLTGKKRAREATEGVVFCTKWQYETGIKIGLV